mmetsp:Transcript_98710/g.235169  ORF Transcript_98710/g.235169 Transcript_98710/m.235169 type:complete len:378 (-) Transcript_98710:76-1209(-)
MTAPGAGSVRSPAAAATPLDKPLIFAGHQWTPRRLPEGNAAPPPSCPAGLPWLFPEALQLALQRSSAPTGPPAGGFCLAAPGTLVQPAGPSPPTRAQRLGHADPRALCAVLLSRASAALPALRCGTEDLAPALLIAADAGGDFPPPRRGPSRRPPAAPAPRPGSGASSAPRRWLLGAPPLFSPLFCCAPLWLPARAPACAAAPAPPAPSREEHAAWRPLLHPPRLHGGAPRDGPPPAPPASAAAPQACGPWPLKPSAALWPLWTFASVHLGPCPAATPGEGPGATAALARLACHAGCGDPGRGSPSPPAPPKAGRWRLASRTEARPPSQHCPPIAPGCCLRRSTLPGCRACRAGRTSRAPLPRSAPCQSGLRSAFRT